MLQKQFSPCSVHLGSCYLKYFILFHLILTFMSVSLFTMQPWFYANPLTLST